MKRRGRCLTVDAVGGNAVSFVWGSMGKLIWVLNTVLFEHVVNCVSLPNHKTDGT